MSGLPFGIYLSGPIGDIPHAFSKLNFDTSERAIKHGTIEGTVVFNPYDWFFNFNRDSLDILPIKKHSRDFTLNDTQSLKWFGFARRIEKLINSGDFQIIAMLMGWEKSKWSKMEYDLALRKGMLVMEWVENRPEGIVFTANLLDIERKMK